MSKLIEVQDGAHSELGPSAAKRWMNCPGSVAATRGVPDEQTIYAASGTASHWLSERCRNEGVRCDEFLGSTVVVGEYKCEVDKARVDSVNAFLDYVYDIGGDMFAEERVAYEEYARNGFGTSDHIAVTPDAWHVIDFKDGEGVQVFAEMCEQLMLYALGFWLQCRWLYGDPEKFVLHIVQPRLNHFDKWEIDLKDLVDWAHSRVMPAAALTEMPDAPFKAGPWCSNNFCRIRRTCKHRAKALMEEAIGDFEDLDAAPMKALPTMSNEDIARVYARFPELTKWMSEIKAHIYAELQHGRPVGDLKLVGGKSSRSFAKSVADVRDEILVYAENEEVDLEAADLFTEPTLKSVAKIEELVGKKAFAAATDKKPAGALAHLVSKTPGRPTIATGDDKRPALTVDALQEFEDLGAKAEADDI